MQTNPPTQATEARSHLKLNPTTRTWALKIVITTFAVIWLSLVAASWADAEETGPTYDQSVSRGDRQPASREFQGSAPSSDDEYNFNWLDPEKKISVLQNRRYLKANRVMFSATVGPGFSNSYRTTYNFDPRVAYYFSESLGVEGFYTFTVNNPNSTFDALVASAGNTRPVIREINSQFGGLLHWVPWYAKINVFNKILYFDWYFSAGLGSVQSTLNAVDRTTGTLSQSNQSLFAGFFGTGHQYHLSHNILVRMDFTGAVYRAPIGGSSSDNGTYSNYNFGLGLGLRL